MVEKIILSIRNNLNGDRSLACLALGCTACCNEMKFCKVEKATTDYFRNIGADIDATPIINGNIKTFASRIIPLYDFSFSGECPNVGNIGNDKRGCVDYENRPPACRKLMPGTDDCNHVRINAELPILIFIS